MCLHSLHFQTQAIKRLGATKERMWANWFPTVYRKILYRPFFCIADNRVEWQWVDRSQQHSISRQIPIHCSCLLIKLAGYKPPLAWWRR